MTILVLLAAFLFAISAPMHSKPQFTETAEPMVVKYVAVSPTPAASLTPTPTKIVVRFLGDPKIKETPKIVMVKDGMKINEQPYFEKAEVGDLVYVYEKSKTVILYRPKENKIIAYVTYSSPTPVKN